MTNQRELDSLLGAFFAEGPDQVADRVLDAALDQVEHITQRRALRMPWRFRHMNSLSRVAVAAVIGLLVVGAGLYITRPTQPPVGGPSPTSSGSPTPPATSQSGRIVFARTIRLQVGEEDCTVRNAGPGTGEGCLRSRIVVANQDGTGERRLFPDGPPTQHVVAMSPDGARLIVTGILPGNDSGLYLTDAHSSEPKLLDTGCTAPCARDDGFAFSPDGSRLAFVRGYAGDPAYPSQADSTVIAIMDLSTGAVVELESTRVANPDVGLPCGYACGEGTDEGPHWSPDGQRLLFTRYDIGTPNKPLTVRDTATFVVDVNGDSLRQLAPTELFARDAQWSPDGSLIVFTSAVEWLTGNTWNYANDIYTVRPDGAGVERLTIDSTAGLRDHGARWTSEGRIVFTRTVLEEEQVWVMDADGQNATRLDSTDVATLTAIGCVVCPAHLVVGQGVGLTMVYWVPAP